MAQDDHQSFFSDEDTEILGREITHTFAGDERRGGGGNRSASVERFIAEKLAEQEALSITDEVEEDRTRIDAKPKTLIMGAQVMPPVLPKTSPESLTKPPAQQSSGTGQVTTQVADQKKYEKKIEGIKDESDPLLGRMLGEYLVTGVIGWGGMGTVYDGIQPDIGKEVAIKVLNPSFSKQKDLAMRFLAEARAVNSIRNAHIIDIFSFGVVEEKYHFFVMERLHGESLGEFLKREEIISKPLAHEIMIQLMNAIGQAHEKGIIHRDLKPDNIFLERRDPFEHYVKVLDFGVAKFMEEGVYSAITKVGTAIGTPLYMSPEQAIGVDVAPESDIYSIGVILFEMFTGTLPFERKSYLEVLKAHMMDPPPRPSSLVPMDERLEHIILKTLAKKKEDRFHSIPELAEVLLPLLKEQ